MRRGPILVRFVSGIGLAMANLAWCQVPVQPPQQPQQQPQQQAPITPNPIDPNAKPAGVSDPALANPTSVDPTKDPTQNPATDITKDPTTSSSADSLGADAGAGAGDIAAQAPDYTGPAILSRGFALSRPAVPVNQHLRFYAGVNATYDSGLFGPYAQGVVSPTVNSKGLDFNWGASALHYRRKDIFQFNYTGDYFDYFSSARNSGLTQNFAGGYTRQYSARLSFGVRETAGLYSNTYSVLNSTAIQDTTTASATIVVAPNTEAFDDRTYFSSTSGTVTYRQTARLSFSFSGAFFLVRRASTDLADTNGYQASADVAYRLTKRQTIGLYYSHSEYSYKKIFGDSNADSIGMNYSVGLSRNSDLSFRLGGTRYDSQSLGSVIPNPLVQQVLGITEGIEKFYFVGYAPDITVTFNRRLRRSSVGASFSEGISPGNGLVLTSKSQSASVFWSLPVYRKWTSQLGVGRSELTGYISGPGDYASYYATFNLSHPVTRYISSYLGFNYRQFGFDNTNFHQKEYTISLGFRLSPPEGTIKVW
jgi:hypothetical protein